jgi:AcrR family transcriptional regulator
VAIAFPSPRILAGTFYELFVVFLRTIRESGRIIKELAREVGETVGVSGAGGVGEEVGAGAAGRENQRRRRARRQRRGLLRAEEILRAAGAVFAEAGYDNATTKHIAARAGVSPGSLYQFFPHKEAIAQAYAADAVAQLHRLYDALLSPPLVTLPFPAFLDTLIDSLVAFNREHPGYLALTLASTLSPSLALALADLQRGVFGRVEAVFAAFWPGSTPAQRRLPGLISYRLFLAVLPLILEQPAQQGEQLEAIVREMKAMMYRYWEPIIYGPQAAPTLGRPPGAEHTRSTEP